jgi:hypothetical protein
LHIYIAPYYAFPGEYEMSNRKNKHPEKDENFITALKEVLLEDESLQIISSLVHAQQVSEEVRQEDPGIPAMSHGFDT